jgi:hypothetical protein
MKKLTSVWILLVLVAIGFADATFFQENFNTLWRTDSAPSGWTIFYQVPVGYEDWHRDSSNTWLANHSGYAKISQPSKSAHPTDTIIDSLISPVIDCWRYRNVTLRCSSYFRHSNGFYTAKIIGSVDGGLTYPYLIQDYYGYYTIPQLDTINLNWAQEQSNVRIAFVFNGQITNIQFWCLDDISLTGEYVYDNDIATIEIIKPSNIQPPGICTLQTKIANLGKIDLGNISVCCSIYNQSGLGLGSASAVVESLYYQESLVVALTPAYDFPVIPGFYSSKSWCQITSDENPANDTLVKPFSIAQNELLTYNSDYADTGYCFPIREQGWGVKLTPSDYPALINRVQCYLGFASESNIQPYGYKIRIVDDDGPGHSPGTTIFESQNITTSGQGWKTTYLFNEELYLDSGSVYLFYIQINDAPDAPLLFHDDAVNPDVQYYKYYNGSYVRDYPIGDWLMQMLVEFRPRNIFDNDLRVVFISEPIDEFVRRPVNIQIPIRARIENIGHNPQNNFVVACTVRSYLHGIPGARIVDFLTPDLSLVAGKDTFIEFFPWNLVNNEPVEITVRTHLPIDQQPENNCKKKIVANKIAKFTGGEGTEIGYAWYDSDTTNGPVFDWHSIEQARLLLDVGDDTIVPTPRLLFNFPYYDSIYNQVYVSTNGFITFSQEQLPSPENSVIPSSLHPNNSLYIFWDDLVLPTDGSAQIYFQEYDSDSDSFCVITWYNIMGKGADSAYRLNFQVILDKNGEIQYQYRDVFCNDQRIDYGKSATIGIENQDGTGGLQYLLGTDSIIENWPENKLSSHRVIKFYRQIRDVGALAILAPADSIVPLPITPYVKIKNYGYQSEDTVPVYLTIMDTLNPGFPVYDTFLLAFNLLPDEERVVQFPDWNANVGSYVVTCSTSLFVDQCVTNNSISDSVLVTVWIKKPDIPINPDKRKVRNGAMVYASDYHKMFSLKGTTDEFWCFDITNNRWESLPRMPWGPSGKKPKAGCALAYAQGRKIYALKGGNKYDFYVYDIVDATWDSLAPIVDTAYKTKKPKDGAGLVYSVYDGLIYAIVGNNTKYILSYIPGEPPQGNYWRYVDRFTYPLDEKGFRHGASINYINNKIYIFRGNKTRELLCYDLTTQSWLDYCTIPGIKHYIKSGGTSTYHNLTNSIYFFLGGNKQGLWRFNVLNNTFDSISSIPRGSNRKKIKSGAAIVAAGPNDPIFILKGGNTTEFWAYAFWSADKKSESRSDFNSSHLNQQTKINQDISLSSTITSLSSDIPVKIDYTLIKPSRIILHLYTITGQLIETLINEEQAAGTYTINWSGLKQPSKVQKGIYFIKGNIGSTPVAKKIIIL